MTAAQRTAPRLYERHAAAADRGGWSVERDIRWGDVDRGLARAQPEILAALRDAAIIESFHPVNLGRLLRLTWDDVDACVALSLEMYEGFKHFHALRTYLDIVNHEPAISDDDLVAARRTAAATDLAPSELIDRLVEFMLSEHLAHYFFRRLGEQAREPVLAELLGRIAADEIRHAQSASDLIAKRIAGDRRLVPRVLDAAAHFHHFGEQAIGAVPVAMPGDPLALRTFARRIERLCGTRLVDHLKASL
ncbi:MAG TPA: hypothetical protein VMM18_13785 [Gemmatimonadaceae bacterium]|nr:hypothetical protein [Gemmatimonadaceae bacterium]